MAHIAAGAIHARSALNVNSAAGINVVSREASIFDIVLRRHRLRLTMTSRNAPSKGGWYAI